MEDFLFETGNRGVQVTLLVFPLTELAGDAIRGKDGGCKSLSYAHHVSL